MRAPIRVAEFVGYCEVAKGAIGETGRECSSYPTKTTTTCSWVWICGHWGEGVGKQPQNDVRSAGSSALLLQHVQQR
jgi:hypothetical protein